MKQTKFKQQAIERTKMIYAIALITFAALGGFVSCLVAGLIGVITMPAAILGALITAIIGWACACKIDRMERDDQFIGGGI